jgi:hypothetical protein
MVIGIAQTHVAPTTLIGTKHVNSIQGSGCYLTPVSHSRQERAELKWEQLNDDFGLMKR